MIFHCNFLFLFNIIILLRMFFMADKILMPITIFEHGLCTVCSLLETCL